MKHSKLTISGPVATGKTTLFLDVYKKLRWPTFSASYFFREFAKNHHVSLEAGEEQEEKLTKVIDYGMSELLKREKHVIVEGWMAGLMAGDTPGVLKVLLICDEQTRIKRFVEREKASIEEATKKIHDREKNLFQKLEEIYGRSDFLDHKNYDLVIDTTHISPEEVLGEVLSHLQ
jgi:CMP/dCMP kinase